MHRQHITKRSKDWRGQDAVFGAPREHRLQTRYEQRSIRSYYRRVIGDELAELQAINEWAYSDPDDDVFEWLESNAHLGLNSFHSDDLGDWPFW